MLFEIYKNTRFSKWILLGNQDLGDNKLKTFKNGQDNSILLPLKTLIKNNDHSFFFGYGCVATKGVGKRYLIDTKDATKNEPKFTPVTGK